MAFTAIYQRPGRKCVGSVRPGLVNLAEAILGDPLPPVPQDRTRIVWGLWPESFNLGAYVCRRVVGSLSLRKSAHGEGRALDVGFLEGDPEGHPSGWALAHRLVAARNQIGLSYLVWAGQSWKAGRGWRPYGGSNRHFDHIHLEVTRDSSERLSSAEAKAAVGPPTTGDDMTPEQAKQLAELHAALIARPVATNGNVEVETIDLGSPIMNANATTLKIEKKLASGPTVVNVKAIAKATVDEMVARITEFLTKRRME